MIFDDEEQKIDKIRPSKKNSKLFNFDDFQDI